MECGRYWQLCGAFPRMWRGGMADSRLGKSKWIRFLLQNKCWQCYQIRRDCRQNYIICWKFSKTTWFINTAFSHKSQKSDKKSQLRPQIKQQQRQIWPHFPVHSYKNFKNLEFALLLQNGGRGDWSNAGQLTCLKTHSEEKSNKCNQCD